MTKFEGVELTSEKSLDPDLVKLCKGIAAKRARTVIDHILNHGIITNEDLSDQYGYDHPPRAIRDVRENGIPLITSRITSPKTGRQIGAYTFGDIADIKRGRIGGRKAFSKQFKNLLVAKYGARDAITSELLDPRYLQIDHRIPYEVGGGDGNNLKPENYMLIDASSQRAKSCSCENCPNFLTLHVEKTCETCFWASPENYTHIALDPVRRVEIVRAGEEVREYELLREAADSEGVSVQVFIKNRLRK